MYDERTFAMIDLHGNSGEDNAASKEGGGDLMSPWQN
jgi:hypothetical protein